MTPQKAAEKELLEAAAMEPVDHIRLQVQTADRMVLEHLLTTQAMSLRVQRMRRGV